MTVEFVWSIRKSLDVSWYLEVPVRWKVLRSILLFDGFWVACSDVVSVWKFHRFFDFDLTHFQCYCFWIVYNLVEA